MLVQELMSLRWLRESSIPIDLSLMAQGHRPRLGALDIIYPKCDRYLLTQVQNYAKLRLTCYKVTDSYKKATIATVAYRCVASSYRF